MSGRNEGPGAASFLVRLWTERRERDGEDRPQRFYIRNLQTGEERYLADGSKLVESLLRQARRERQEERDSAPSVESQTG